MLTNPEYHTEAQTIDGWKATLTTYNASSDSHPLYYYIQLWFEDADSNNRHYVVYADCYSKESLDVAKAMFRTIRFKVSKRT